MVLFKTGPNGNYILYYRHTDGYPTGMGVDLIDAIRTTETRDFYQAVKEIAEKCALQDEKRSIDKPEDAFLKVQGDLEYLYVIENLYEVDTRSLTIYKTSNPRKLPDFVFSIWFSYAQFFPEDVGARMGEIERTARIILKALEAYHQASIST